jgi:hypothetical protein
MPAPTITLGTVTLPPDLRWRDEFAWTPVQRTAEYGLTGALIVQESVKQAGRPITLEAKSEAKGYVWLNRATLLALKTLAETAGWSGTLTLADGRAFTVAFRDDGLTAEPVIHLAHTGPLDALPYTFTLKLQTV